MKCIIGGNRKMWTKSWMRWVYLSRKFRCFTKKWNIFLLHNIGDRRWHEVLGLVDIRCQQVNLDNLSFSLNFSWYDRDFVALQGYFQQKMHRMNTTNEALLGSSLLEICTNSPYCEGVSKDGQSSFFQYEKILFERFMNDTDWTTFLPLNLVLLKNKRRPGLIHSDFYKTDVFLH